MPEQSKQQKIHQALVDLLVKQVKITGLANIVMLTVVAVVIWSEKEELFAWLWLVAGYLLTAFRAALFVGIKKKIKALATPLQIERVVILLLVLSGLHWGVAAWVYLDPDDTQLFAFLSAALLGLVSATIPSLSARPIVWLAYSTPLFFLAAAKLAYIENWSMLALVILGQFLLIVISRNLGKRIEYSITQEYINAELLKEVSAAKEAAEKANLGKSQFMAAASHDLRQPLHAQSILLEVLSLHLRDGESRELVKKIIKSNEALSGLFNALLEISQLDAGTLKTNISHQNLADCSKNLLDEYKLVAEQKGLEFTCFHEKGIVISDPVLLNRILSNLISNAIKFTSAGSVHVDMTIEEESVLVRVIDTGIGIDSSQYQHIFNEFVQVGNKARDRSQGIGLGLAVVRRLCQLLGHQIEITPNTPNGTCFTLTMPRGEEKSILTEVVNINDNTLDNIKVLLIDDEITIVDAMTLMLKNWGCHVDAVLSLEEALKRLREIKHCPDLIISDYRLNGIETGLEGLHIIQKSLGKNIPSLLVTGDTSTELLKKINQHGFYVLHKPVKPSQLKKVIGILMPQCNSQAK